MTFVSGLVETIRAGLAPHGLSIRGLLDPGAEARPVGLEQTTESLVLVGHAGGGFWPHFEAWRQAAEDRGGPDPLDAFSKAVIDPVAARVGGIALYPSDKPWQPFQRWAIEAEGLKASPLGILIHPDYGLWHGFRGAIALPVRLGVPPPAARPHPCEACRDKPCLTQCPAGAVGPDRFDVSSCRGHLATPDGEAGCMVSGCLSRNACPVGAQWRYGPAQLAFHMQALSR